MAHLTDSGLIVVKSASAVLEGVETKRLLVPSMAQAKLDGDGRTLTGYGSVFGNVDLDKDVIDHGAFTEGLEEFVRDGFLGWMHDWGYDGPPVGFFAEAAEDEHGLYLAARFHSTGNAEQVRTWVAERLAAGKSVGLSIGFRILGWERDAAGIRHITKAKLYEVSVVTVPANPKAQVTGLKARPSIDLGGPPLEGAKSFPEQYLARVEALAESRNAQGRKLAADLSAEATEVADAWEAGAKRLRDLVTPKAEAPAPALDPDHPDLIELRRFALLDGLED